MSSSFPEEITFFSICNIDLFFDIVYLGYSAYVKLEFSLSTDFFFSRIYSTLLSEEKF